MMSKKSEVSKKPEVSRKPLELLIKITVDRKDPDALVRLLIKQQKELLSAADLVNTFRISPWSG